MTIPRCDIDAVPLWIVLTSIIGCAVLGGSCFGVLHWMFERRR